MKTPLVIILSALTFHVGCDTTTNKKEDEKIAIINDTLKQDSSNTTKLLEESLKTIPKDINPVFGYRFMISGDFDGDGIKENLIEHYVSDLDKTETNKFYDNLTDYEQLVALTIKKEAISFATSDNKRIDTLHISSNTQQFGLAFMKNEGDLNGDGTDEVSYVIHWADWSNLNTWYLVTYKNKKWTELYSFSIWDWQLPDLPGTLNQYGPIGLDNKIISASNDTINKHLDEELFEFKGLVKNFTTNKIEVIFRNDEAIEDTIIVDLKHLK